MEATLVDDWLEHVAVTCTDTTYDFYRGVLEQMVGAFGLPQKWTSKTVTNYLAYCRERGNTDASRHSKLGAVKSFIRWAGDNLVDMDAPTGVKHENRQPIAATEDEVMVLLTAHTLRDPRWQRALLLMSDAGLRETEVRRLKWEDVAADALTVHGKGRKLRRIPAGITKRLTDILSDGGEDRAYVVPGHRGRMLARGYLNHLLRKACTETKLERRLTPHCFRHGFASRAAAQGVPIKAIQMALGHSSLVTTDRYLASLDGNLSLLESGFASFC